MADNRQFDSLVLRDMALPFVPNKGKLAEQPVLSDGSNVYVTWGGTIAKRPGTFQLPNTATLASAQCERLWVYETLETLPVVYLVGSFLIGGTYQLRYCRIDIADTWHTPTERRGCNHSVYPHEGLVKRGFMYIKGFPNAVSDPSKLGCIRLDGTGGTMVTHDWGAIGPQNAVALFNPAGWSPSAHTVTVNSTWIYVYTWVMASGQETNHSPLQTNPDLAPSSSGPFTNKIPAMTVTGGPDATEYPFVNVYRTTDGGGTFFFLHQIANSNPGGNITFNDTFLASSSGNADPLPDTQLNTALVAPANLANSPPPTVAPPFVTGTDPIQRCSRIIEYSNRIWYAIGNFVFYSALEELSVGIPEESWPSGILQPNFFEMPRTVTQMISTPNGVLVPMRRGTIRVNGTTKATFNPRTFLGSIGGAANFQNRGAIEAGENVAWVTEDYRIAVVNGDSFAILSDPISNVEDSFQTALAANPNVFIDLKFWTQGDKEYLVVGIFDYTTTGNSFLQIYDLARARKTNEDFWFPQWLVSASAMVTGQSSTTDTENKFILASWDTITCRITQFDIINGTTSTDPNPTTGVAVPIGWFFTIALLPTPSGNHVNVLREPYLSSVISSVEYERTVFGDVGEADPSAFGYTDDFFTSPIPLSYPGDSPARRPQSKGYKTIVENNFKQACKHAAVTISSAGAAFPLVVATTYRAEIHQLIMTWIPDQGA